MKPILFNTEMVRAILNGEKTTTRRLVKPAHLRVLKSQYYIEHPEVQEKTLIEKLCEPPYQPDDILYVRETWGDYRECEPCGALYYMYRADYSDGATTTTHPDGTVFDLPRWRPSIHMPKEAARIFLKVTEVRVERLFDSFFAPGATIFNLRAEGINTTEVCAECIETYGYPCCNDEDAEGSECGNLDDVRDEFAKLWDSTIKPADRDRFGWRANPWVWVISFERCEKPEEAD